MLLWRLHELLYVNSQAQFLIHNRQTIHYISVSPSSSVHPNPTLPDSGFYLSVRPTQTHMYLFSLSSSLPHFPLSHSLLLSHSFSLVFGDAFCREFPQSLLIEKSSPQLPFLSNSRFSNAVGHRAGLFSDIFMNKGQLLLLHM